jgi:hypothetical protein
MRKLICISIIMAAAVVFLAGISLAQDAPAPVPVTPAVETAPVPAAATAPAPTPAPKFEAPAVVCDTELFRRTPIIDGVVEDGEWDIYYTFTASGWDAMTYANWDGANFYVAAKSNKPIDILAILDANADGWFHGEDNFEFRTTRGAGDVIALSVNRYESRNTKSPAAMPVTEQEAALVQAKSGKTDTAYMIELKIPASLIRGYKQKADKSIGFQINLNAGDDFSGWFPARELGDTKECTLVTKKIAALKPLELGFDLRDSRIALGEELIGKFHLTNSGTETADARSFIIAGEGKAGEFLSSEKIRMEGLSPKKHFAHEVRSIVPSDMRLGSWAIGAEVRSGSDRLGSALISFEVVEPFDIELRVPEKSVKSDVKDVTFGVGVRNNTRHRIRGVTKITLPIGWELWRNADTREFSVPTGDAVTSTTFKAKPPLGALGDVPVKMEVTIEGRTKIVEGKIVVVNP